MIYIAGCGFMTGIFLTVRETASLMGVTERWARQQITDGKIKADKTHGVGGAGGTQYNIPLAALDERFRLKYERKLRGCSEPPPDETDVEPLNILSLTEDERGEIAQWETITREWQRFRFGSELSAAEADAEFIAEYQTKYPTVTISRRILYKRWSAVKDGDKAALYDKRGKHGNHARLVSDLMWDIFLSCYLDESKPSAEKCVTDVWLELEAQVKEGLIAEMPKMPQTSAFLRKAKTIPRPVLAYFRGGEYEYSSECAPYIRREYDNLESNEWWVADNHTFDVVLWDGKAPVRLYLTAFMDARSRKMVGWCVTDRPNSDATLCAMRRGIEGNGVPQGILTDNGREFLFHDFGGQGFRHRKKLKEGEFKPFSILTELDIKFRTAIPLNARAKPVERAFKTLCGRFSKYFDSYTGSNVVEKPDRLKLLVKNPDKLTTVEAFIKKVDTWIGGWYNKQPSRAPGMDGKCPDQVFAENLVEKRVAHPEQLDKMMMRWSNPITVGPNGVTLKFYGIEIQYTDTENLWLPYCGQKVLVRYTPENLREVVVLDMDGKFICRAKQKNEASWNENKESLAERQRENRAADRLVKTYKKQLKGKKHDELELMLAKAKERLGEEFTASPETVKIIASSLGEETKTHLGVIPSGEEFRWADIV
jgi:hypothetical protein